MSLTSETTLGRRAFFRTHGTDVATAVVAEPAALAQDAPVEPAALAGAGFNRYQIGSKTITVLADGNGFFPGQSLSAINATPEDCTAVQEQVQQPAQGVDFAMNALLMQEGNHKTLIDEGFGHFPGPQFGRNALALANADVKPAEQHRARLGVCFRVRRSRPRGDAAEAARPGSRRWLSSKGHHAGFPAVRKIARVGEANNFIEAPWRL
jgi:hypothetical protein